MKFSELVNRNKNIIGGVNSRRIEASISVSEERDKFYSGALFKKHDLVESDGVQYRILEQCSNYYQVVDEFGNVSRKFAKQLNPLGENEIHLDEKTVTIHGYTPKNLSEITADKFRRYIEEIKKGDADDVGILRQLKEADKTETYKAKDKLTVAKIIADTFGVDSEGSAESMVNAAISKAKRDQVMMKNIAMVSSMLKIARDVGIKYNDKFFDEVKEDSDETTKQIGHTLAPNSETHRIAMIRKKRGL